MLRVIYETLGRALRTARPAWRLFSTLLTLSILSRLWLGCGRFLGCMRCRGCRRFRGRGQWLVTLMRANGGRNRIWGNARIEASGAQKDRKFRHNRRAPRQPRRAPKLRDGVPLVT